MSQRTHFWSEIEDLNAQIPEGKLEYLREQVRNDLYHFVIAKFLEQEETRGLNKADLARRLACDPARLNRLLGAPGNWTLKTVSDLLVGIAGETLVPQSTRVPGATVRNMSSVDLLSSYSDIKLYDKQFDIASTSGESTIVTNQIQ